MIKTYMAEIKEDATVSVIPIEPKPISPPNNEAQTMLLAHYWAEHSPAGQLDFFTIGKILDLDDVKKDRPWLNQFCYSDRPGRAVFDLDTENEDEIRDPNQAARQILWGLSDVRELIYQHEEEIRDLYTYPIYKT